jgi:hypothetical protein
MVKICPCIEDTAVFNAANLFIGCQISHFEIDLEANKNY